MLPVIQAQQLGVLVGISVRLLLRLIAPRSLQPLLSTATLIFIPGGELCSCRLYRRRWRIEAAFSTVKRLLGLAYLWTGSINGVQLQIWATWLFYAVLVDLGDAVADEVGVPFDSISLEMLYRGMYHFGVAYDKGRASEPVRYFAAPENQDLRGVKIRKKEAPLDLSPFPRPRLTFSPSS